MQSPNSSNRWSLIILFLASVGIPSIASFTFAEKVTQNPILTIVLAVIYEVAVLFVGFATLVGQRLGERSVDRVVVWLETRAQEIYPKYRYRKRYLKHLQYRHRDFDVKGLTTQGIYTLELEQVFVDLSVVPTPGHRISTNMLNVPVPLRKGQHSIWDYINSQSLAQQDLVIIGAPGSGKTTLLKHMTLALSVGKDYRQRVNVPTRTPILLFLREHANSIKEKYDLTLEEVVSASIKKLKGPPMPKGWLEALLQKGRCIIMLDGLDEVADPLARDVVVEWVEAQLLAYPQNQFIISSRPHGYHSNPIGGVTVLEVRPFTTEQVQQFIRKWYLANEIMSTQKDDPGVQMRAEEGAEDLLSRLNNTPALKALAVNPLLLTMIANVHRFRSSLPGRRVELYAEICEVCLGKRQQARGMALELTPAQKQRVLQPLAYHMMSHQQREISKEEALTVIVEPLTRVSPRSKDYNYLQMMEEGADFLKMIEDSSGLLLERENSKYIFAHLTFQEYLAAVHVHQQKLESDLVQHIGDSWWHETIRLYVAQADATPIITACMGSDQSTVTALTLAIECLKEAREVQLALRNKLEAILLQGVEDVDPERRRVVTEVLLALRLRRMVSTDKEMLYFDGSLLTNAEYQLFLDESYAQGSFFQPDHWLEKQFPTGIGRTPVVGVRPSDVLAFCKWLTEREGNEWQYRPPQLEEFDTHTVVDNTYVGSTASVGYWTISGSRAKAVRPNLSTSGISEKLLKQRFAHDQVRALINYTDFVLRRVELQSHNLVATLTFAVAKDYDGEVARQRVRLLGRELQEAALRADDLAHFLTNEIMHEIVHDLNHATTLINNRVRELDLENATTNSKSIDWHAVKAVNHVLHLAQPLSRDRWLVEYAKHQELLEKVIGSIVDVDYQAILDEALVRVYSNGPALNIDRILYCADVLARTDAHYSARLFSNALEQALSRKKNRSKEAHSNKFEQYLRWYSRICALSLAAELKITLDHPSLLLRTGRFFGLQSDNTKQLFDTAMDLYVDLVILEERMQGRVPVFEGIRLVKEIKTLD